MKPFCTVVKVKGRFLPVYAMKVYKGSKGIKLPFITKALNEGKKVLSSVVNITPQVLFG